MSKPETKTATVAQVLQAVAKASTVRVAVLRIPSARPKVAEARKVAIALLHDRAGLSFNTISKEMYNGRMVGGTVQQAYRNADPALYLRAGVELDEIMRREES